MSIKKLSFGLCTLILLLFSIACTESVPQNKAGNGVTASEFRGSDEVIENATDKSTLNGYILRNDSGNRIAANDIAPLAAHEGLDPSHVRGARIYDDFTIELTVAPTGVNPILAIATPTDSNMATPTDADTWRCSHCHGFDYEGGVYTFNNGATNNLLELQSVRERDEEFVISMLMNGFDAWDGTAVVNVHNYTDLLTPQSMVDVSDFVVNEIFDTHQYIQAPSSGGLGDHMEGMDFYNSVAAAGEIPPVIRVDGSNFNCVGCHGDDGLLVAGIDLYTLAWSQPFQWLHRVNFGSPRSLASYPDFISEDAAVHPGLYEVILTHGLHFGGPEQASALMSHAQTNLIPAP